MPPDALELSRQIVAAKAELRQALPNYREVFAELEAEIGREAEAIAARPAAGDPVVPDIAYADVAADRVSPEAVAAIRRHGCAVVRGVFPREQAEAWDAELLDYVQSNHYAERAAERAGLDNYFSQQKVKPPQIYGIYWSRPQVAARQAESLAATRAWLNRLWKHDGHFVPDREVTYADRIRQRAPGDNSLGLAPHVDGGSVERWIDPGFRHVYRRVFAGAWRAHDVWDGEGRTRTREIPSPAVCQLFRTFQGWTALTEQGPGNGTLQLVPIANAIAYLLLRPLQDDVPEDELCDSKVGRPLLITEQWHAPLLRAMVPLPTVRPGDTVWWHSDVVHAVENENRGRGYSSVIYIGSAPDCAKNREYLPPQKAAFLAGRSAPDFAPENYEVDFAGRATETDLTPLGRRQMGFDPWV